MTNDQSNNDRASQPSVFYSRTNTELPHGGTPADVGDVTGTGVLEFVDLGVTGLTPMKDRPQGAALLEYCAHHPASPETPGFVWIGRYADLGRSLDVILDCLFTLAACGWRVRIVRGGSLLFGPDEEDERVGGED